MSGGPQNDKYIDAAAHGRPLFQLPIFKTSMSTWSTVYKDQRLPSATTLYIRNMWNWADTLMTWHLGNCLNVQVNEWTQSHPLRYFSSQNPNALNLDVGGRNPPPTPRYLSLSLLHWTKSPTLDFLSPHLFIFPSSTQHPRHHFPCVYNPSSLTPTPSSLHILKNFNNSFLRFLISHF